MRSLEVELGHSPFVLEAKNFLWNNLVHRQNKDARVRYWGGTIAQFGIK